MSERQRRSAHKGGGDDPLLRALRELGADYEPDVAKINRRVERVHSGHRSPTVPDRTGDRWRRADRAPAHPDSGRLAGTLRHSRPVLLPAAAVLLVIGGVVLVTAQRPDSGAGPAATGPTTSLSPSGAPVATTATAGPSRIGTAVSATQAPATTTTTTTTTAGATPPSRSRAAAVTVQSPAASTTVDLSRPALLDWLVVGSRSDLKQVRAKAHAVNPLISVDQPATATSANGPFQISWSDGVPEQDHTAATGWLESPAAPGLSVTVAASPHPRTLVLYAAAGTPAWVSVSGNGITTSRTLLRADAGSAKPLQVTIGLPATSGPTRVQLVGAAHAPATARVYLAAVTLR